MLRNKKIKFTLIELLISMTIASMLFVAVAQSMFTLLAIESSNQEQNNAQEVFGFFDPQISEEIRSSTSAKVSGKQLMLTQPDNSIIKYKLVGKNKDKLERQLKSDKKEIIQDVKEFNISEKDGVVSYELIISTSDGDISIKNVVKVRVEDSKNGPLISWKKL